MIIRRLLTAAVLATLSLGLTGFASGGDLGLSVVNDSGRTMVRLFVGRNQVLDQPLAPGQSVWITADDGNGNCDVVLTSMFDDGSRTSGRVNVCQVSQYPASARGIPMCPGDARCKGTS
jgi:hypothetical protein